MTASVETAWWVVTDLDGTLLDHSYDWSPAKRRRKCAAFVQGRGFMTRTSLKTVAPFTGKPLQGSLGSCRWARIGRS
jgi:hypothetical protein